MTCIFFILGLLATQSPYFVDLHTVADAMCSLFIFSVVKEYIHLKLLSFHNNSLEEIP